jgi:AcrR family transcriptional regulator
MAPRVKRPDQEPDVPSDRRYQAPQRAQAAAQTRARIRTAASTLFVEQGYVATTMRDIARAAGVGERTVYAAFPSKADLFRHVLDVATVGDEQPVAVANRPQIQDAFGQTDPRTAISQAIDYTVALFERAGDLIMVTVQAADADPDMRAAADAGSHATRQLWRTLTHALNDAGALRPGLTAQRAADILYALAHRTPTSSCDGTAIGPPGATTPGWSTSSRSSCSPTGSPALRQSTTRYADDRNPCAHDGEGGRHRGCLSLWVARTAAVILSRSGRSFGSSSASTPKRQPWTWISDRPR